MKPPIRLLIGVVNADLNMRKIHIISSLFLFPSLTLLSLYQALQYGSEDNSTIIVVPFGAWGKHKSSEVSFSFSRSFVSSGRFAWAKNNKKGRHWLTNLNWPMCNILLIHPVRVTASKMTIRATMWFQTWQWMILLSLDEQIKLSIHLQNASFPRLKTFLVSEIMSFHF